jgi:hypothetical protein
VQRLVLAALVAASAALPLAPASAAPWCTGAVGVNCWNGSRICRIYVQATRTCTYTA